MHDDSPYPEEEEHWVIWNASYGIVDTVMISRIEEDSDGRSGWLEEPYDMVGPFNLDELETNGQINFAACTVMSREQWKQKQVVLRREALEKRRHAQAEMFEEFARYNEQRKRHRSHFHHVNETEKRELLNLPLEGTLEVAQIKAAFRKIAKEAHPDVGGSHEHFVLITEARDALIECLA